MDGPAGRVKSPAEATGVAEGVVAGKLCAGWSLRGGLDSPAGGLKLGDDGCVLADGVASPASPELQPSPAATRMSKARTEEKVVGFTVDCRKLNRCT
jgi:hypothetical protein